MDFYKILILAVIFGISFACMKAFLSLLWEAVQRRRS